MLTRGLSRLHQRHRLRAQCTDQPLLPPNRHHLPSRSSAGRLLPRQDIRCRHFRLQEQAQASTSILLYLLLRRGSEGRRSPASLLKTGLHSNLRLSHCARVRGLRLPLHLGEGASADLRRRHSLPTIKVEASLHGLGCDCSNNLSALQCAPALHHN